MRKTKLYIKWSLALLNLSKSLLMAVLVGGLSSLLFASHVLLPSSVLFSIITVFLFFGFRFVYKKLGADINYFYLFGMVTHIFIGITLYDIFAYPIKNAFYMPYIHPLNNYFTVFTIICIFILNLILFSFSANKNLTMPLKNVLIIILWLLPLLGLTIEYVDLSLDLIENYKVRLNNCITNNN